MFDTPTCREYITGFLKKHITASDEQMINGFNKYMLLWSLSSKEKKCSSIRRVLRSMRQKGEVQEVKRLDRPCKGAESLTSSEVFYQIPLEVTEVQGGKVTTTTYGL